MKEMRKVLAIINSIAGVTVLAIICTSLFSQQHTTTKTEVDSAESIGIIGGSNAPTAVWMSSQNGYETWLYPVAFGALFVANAVILFNSVKKT
jgi:Na+-transporting methylmalonyl-CoA/oxaloacetate decarboxylase beta subunit